MATKSLNAPSYAPPFNPRITPVAPQDKSGSAATANTDAPSARAIFFMAGLAERRMQFSFMELSYRGGPEYKRGKDAQGYPILIEHENERVDPLGSTRIPTASEVANRSEAALKGDKYTRRQRTAVYVNLAKPIQDIYRAYVLSVPPSRPDSDEEIKAELSRVKIDENIDEMVEDGLKFEEAWIGFDARQILPGANGRTSKQDAIDQDPEHQGKPYIVRHDPRCIVDFSESAETVTRVVIEEDVVTKTSIAKPEERRTFYREWTATEWTLFELVDDGKGGQTLARVGGSPHKFGRCPYRRVRFKFPAKDLCELNKYLFNKQSLLDEENYQNTFTQRWASGTSAEEFSRTDRGAGNTILLPNPESKLGIIGGDPAQAEVLMKIMGSTVQAMYDLVAYSPVNKNVAESAEKKVRDLESLYKFLGQIADEVEEAENWLLVAMGVYPAEDETKRSRYGKNFDVYSATDLMAQLEGLGKASFTPPTLKRRLSVALAGKLDPFGPQDQYKAEADELFDAQPTAVDALMSMKREGAMTPDMLAAAISLPAKFMADLEEAMASHPDPNAPGGISPGNNDGGPDVPDVPEDSSGPGGGGEGGDGVGPGGGSPRPSDGADPASGADAGGIQAGGGNGRAGGVRRKAPRRGGK